MLGKVFWLHVTRAGPSAPVAEPARTAITTIAAGRNLISPCYRGSAAVVTSVETPPRGSSVDVREAAAVGADGVGGTLRRIDAAGTADDGGLGAGGLAAAAAVGGAAGAAGPGAATAFGRATAARAEQHAGLARVAADLVLIAVVDEHLDSV